MLGGNEKGRRLYGRPRYRSEDNIKMDLNILVVGLCTVFMWLRIGSNSGVLWTRTVFDHLRNCLLFKMELFRGLC
jgi:hypothetical protein